MRKWDGGDDGTHSWRAILKRKLRKRASHITAKVNWTPFAGRLKCLICKAAMSIKVLGTWVLIILFTGLEFWDTWGHLSRIIFRARESLDPSRNEAKFAKMCRLESSLRLYLLSLSRRDWIFLNTFRVFNGLHYGFPRQSEKLNGRGRRLVMVFARSERSGASGGKWAILAPKRKTS